MTYRLKFLRLVAMACMWLAPMIGSIAFAQEDPAAAEIRKESDKLTAAFSSGKADEVAAMFLAKGELIDEAGTVYQGQPEIKALVTAFVEKFPGTQMTNEIESIRVLGTIAIQEGRRVTTAKDGTVAAMRYTSVLAKTDQGWRIASLRDFGDESPTTPGELLAPLAWLIGDWINEGSDARVKLSYRWSEDMNFILGEILVMKSDKVVMKSSQRIGWDALLGTPRSWTFDSDGGFTESTWTQVDDSWTVRSSAVMPDGLTGSAILKITNAEPGRYTMTGTNRIIGNAMEEDYQITVVKLPPTAGK
jgi:uncharacterized protein (TIGR02246 family)